MRRRDGNPWRLEKARFSLGEERPQLHGVHARAQANQEGQTSIKQHLQHTIAKVSLVVIISLEE